MKKQLLSFLLAALLAFSLASAETVQDPVIATVNGEALLHSTYAGIESVYLQQYSMSGMNLSDPASVGYVQDLALTHAIEQILVDQDMHAQGCYTLDAETETWCRNMGAAAYEAALEDVMDAMRSQTTSEDELMVYALAYAKSLNVTKETYVDFYRTQYASAQYHNWLIKDHPVTDEDIRQAYEERTAQSKALYENDVPAFENALSNGEEVWYTPAGYRTVLQILLPAQGDTNEARLESAQAVVETIDTRLESGESFQDLIREYGIDTAFADESFFSVGYQVHPESVTWAEEFVAAAFSADMAQPGCWSQPFASDLGVHILYYLGDLPSGPIELTEELSDALAYSIFTQRYTQAQDARLDELADAAEIIFY